MNKLNTNQEVSALYQSILDADKGVCTIGDPRDILNRLREFFELFLQDGLNSEFAYTFGLKNA